MRRRARPRRPSQTELPRPRKLEARQHPRRNRDKNPLDEKKNKARASPCGCPLHRTFPHGIRCDVGRGPAWPTGPFTARFHKGFGAASGAAQERPAALFAARFRRGFDAASSAAQETGCPFHCTCSHGTRCKVRRGPIQRGPWTRRRARPTAGSAGAPARGACRGGKEPPPRRYGQARHAGRPKLRLRPAEGIRTRHQARKAARASGHEARRGGEHHRHAAQPGVV